jgi:hypothetical protein
MNSTIQYGSKDHARYVTEYELVERLSLEIDENIDSLEWVTVCLTEAVNLDPAGLS